MQFKKTILSIIGLAILGLSIFGILQATRHPKLRELRVIFKDKIGIVFANLRESIIPPTRRQPFTTIQLEESLKSNLPVPFSDFNKEDWEWFWHLLYGKFSQEEGKWPKRQRQLTKEEIQNVLTNYYYRPFGYFGQRQWSLFWQQVLKGKVFKEEGRE